MEDSYQSSDGEIFRIRYVSPAIVRCEDYQFCVVYSDKDGEVHLDGFQVPAEAGSMLYLPPASEWDVRYPNRRGQREKIKERLLSFASQEKYFAFIERSLNDPSVYERFSSAIEKLRPKPAVESKRSVRETVALWLSIRRLKLLFAANNAFYSGNRVKARVLFLLSFVFGKAHNVFSANDSSSKA